MSEEAVFECEQCGDGDALRAGESCAYCGLDLADDEIGESNALDEIRRLAENLREMADAVERLVEAEIDPEGDFLLTGSVSVYTNTAEEFKAFAKKIGAAKKQAFGSSFYLERQFGGGATGVSLIVYAPSREAVCKKKVVGKREVEETEYVKTGRIIVEDVVEWDCSSILKGTGVE